MKDCIKKLLAKNDLTRAESHYLFSRLEHIPVEQQAAIIALLVAKGEAIEELLGAMEFLFEHTVQIKSSYDVIDIVGTGGDGIDTFNISTAASFVAASCGAHVAKHGGRSATGKSGSTDVLETLGITLHHTPKSIIKNIEKYHYAYLSAPLFNNALKQFGTLRKNLGFPTIFNILGPLVNPIKPKRQVIGVYKNSLTCVITEILKITGSKHALVVHSEDGLDEISISASTHITELKDGIVREYTITPHDAGLPISSLNEVLGGSSAENSNIINGILYNKIIGPKLDIVLLNSAAGLLVAGIADNLREGVEIARHAIQSGKASALLSKLQSEDVYE